MGSEFSRTDIIKLQNDLAELPELRREVSRLTSATERQTRVFEEQMLDVRLALWALMAVVALGVLAVVITLSLTA